MPLAILLLLFALGTAFAQFAGYDAGEIAEARDRVLSDARYQTEMPAPEESTNRKRISLPPWLGKAILWTVIAGVVAVVLFFLFSLTRDLLRDRTAFRRNRDKAVEVPLQVTTPPAGQREADPGSLAEADRLAAAGRFGEAIHLLLMVAMERLHRELGPRVAPAMTSREVLRLPALPEATVAPLTRMVELSEISHFGGRRAGEPDYRSARDGFLRFSGEAPVAA
ncbi:MAG: hypothetical protein ACFCUW_14075 [Kiloniellaceae bacterium]